MNLRNISRLSMNRVMFKPYTNEQIETIINVLMNFRLFDRIGSVTRIICFYSRSYCFM